MILTLMDKLRHHIGNYVAVKCIKAANTRADLEARMDPERAYKLHGYRNMGDMLRQVRRYS